MDPEFVDGLIVKAPRQGAPDFVKGSISIKRAELANWLQGKNDEWINLDIKVSKAGKWYTQVNTWKPNGDGGSNQNNQFNSGSMPEPTGSAPDYPDDDIDPADIPF